MRLFDADDYVVLQEWFTERDRPAPPFVYLPKTGFIEDYYAAGFLIESDIPVATIDFLVSNPSAPLSKRHDAIHSVVLALIEEAKRKKYRAIRCTSQIRSVARLAKSFGFSDVGEFRAFYREI